MLERIDLLLSRAEYLMQPREREFLASLRIQWNNKHSISPGQENWYNSLEQKYSAEFVELEKVWQNQWSADHRVTALRVARYYEANPPYFSKCVLAVLSDPESFYLSKKQWDRFCENKYAKKIRNEYTSPKKFEKGDCVQIRKKNKISQANYNSKNVTWPPRNMENKIAFVLGVDVMPITRAAKGSRIYQILLAGDSCPIYAHESDLKKPRGLKGGKKN